jgi:DNA-binding transcriptional LysR family regulator
MMLEKSEPQGDLNVTCSTALGERFVAPLARSFAIQHPKIRLTLDLSNRVIDLVAEGFDLAVRTGVLPSSSLIATKIAERRLFTCASDDYLDKVGVPQSVDDLNRYDCVVGTSSIWHFAVDGVERLYRPNSRWRCNNGQAVLAAALEGMGICQLPDFYVQEAFRQGTLVPVLQHFTAPVEPIWAVYPGRKHLAPKVRQFVDLLKERMPASLAGF